jgi:hypothetical protein
VDWLKRRWWVLLAGLCVVPYFAFQAMKERKAREGVGLVVELSPRLPGVRYHSTGTTLGEVEYADGSRFERDGLGVVVLTREAHAADPGPLKGVEVKPEDFPLVAFFNSSGHDASGNAVRIRRAADGKQVYESASAPFTSLVVIDGADIRLPLVASGARTVPADEWYTRYLGMTPAPPEAPKAPEKAPEKK